MSLDRTLYSSLERPVLERHSQMLARTACSIFACGLVLSFAFAIAVPTDARAQDKQADLKAEKLQKRIVEPRNNAVEPTRMPIQLVDGQGRPVKGAIASTYFQRNADREPAFKVPERHESATSNERGELTLSLAIPSHLDAAGIYAIRQDQGLPIVGMQRVSREEIREGKPVRVVMHPACRVRMRIECPGHVELAEKFHADLGGANWWRSAYVWLGEDQRSPRHFTPARRADRLNSSCRRAGSWSWRMGPRSITCSRPSRSNQVSAC